MKRFKKVVLIVPPWIFGTQGPEFISQQLASRYLASTLLAQDHEVVIIDALIEGLEHYRVIDTGCDTATSWGLPYDQIVARIPEDVDIIGISIPFTDSAHTANPLSHLIRARFPNVPIVYGGIYPSAMPETALEMSAANIAVIGDGELTFSRIVNGTPWEQIPGVAFFNRDGEFVKTTGPEYVYLGTSYYTDKVLDDRIPIPTVDLVPMERYVRSSGRGSKDSVTATLFTTRGCPFDCTFCSIHVGIDEAYKLRVFSPERVIQEIQIGIDRFGITHVEFEDDNLTLDRRHAVALFKAMADLRTRDGKKVHFAMPNGVMIKTLDQELIELMVAAGCELAYLPVENGDPKILEAMQKPGAEKHLEKTFEVAALCQKAGLSASAFIMLAYPGEDEGSFQKTFDFCKRLADLGVFISPLVTTPYPGTHLYNECVKNGWLTFDPSNVHRMFFFQAYSEFLPKYVRISTPWCSQEQAYLRHRRMMEAFATRHNTKPIKTAVSPEQ